MNPKQNNSKKNYAENHHNLKTKVKKILKTAREKDTLLKGIQFK